jgi:hypothetical protein
MHRNCGWFTLTLVKEPRFTSFLLHMQENIFSWKCHIKKISLVVSCLSTCTWSNWKYFEYQTKCLKIKMHAMHIKRILMKQVITSWKLCCYEVYSVISPLCTSKNEILIFSPESKFHFSFCKNFLNRWSRFGALHWWGHNHWLSQLQSGDYQTWKYGLMRKLWTKSTTHNCHNCV